MYAIENGPSGFDPANPAYLPKQRFLMLMRNARLAELRTRFDEKATADHPRREPRGRARQPPHAGRPRRDRALFRGALRRRTARTTEGTVRRRSQLLGRGEEGGLDHQSRLGRGPGKRHWRSGPSAPLPRQSLRRRLAGLARVRSGRRRDRHRRKRAAEIVKRIVRCAATEVDPDTGIRDLQIPRTLMKAYGHADCGIYGEVSPAARLRSATASPANPGC